MEWDPFFMALLISHQDYNFSPHQLPSDSTPLCVAQRKGHDKTSQEKRIYSRMVRVVSFHHAKWKEIEH